MTVRHHALGFTLAFLATLAVLAVTPVAAADLVLKRVMLSSGGVAYLEYEIGVDGDAEVGLDVPLDQVDDILKSLAIYDSKGGVSSARLNGRNPLSQTFSDLPFGENALESAAALLNALQGAEITTGVNHVITGRILKVTAETVRISPDETSVRNRVSVLTAGGLQQFVLETADDVKFTDPSLQAKVEKALDDIAAHRAKDRRHIDLSIHGTGQRVVRIGYVVGAPLWKASYRVTLPKAAESRMAHAQGWAVLENMTGQDWRNVELTLLSGHPVSFRQAIYEAYYVRRPDVPVEVSGLVLPKPDTDNGGVPLAAGAASAPMPAPGPMRKSFARESDEPMRPVAGLMSAPPPIASHAVDTAIGDDGATQVAFRLPVPVTVASGQSAMVPILDRDLPVERVGLYQSDTVATHPFAALRVTNDAGVGLPPGVLTLYEEGGSGVAYVGDARLSDLPPGESRLLSYALDGKTKVVRAMAGEARVTGATIAEGVLKLTRLQRRSISFDVTAPASEARTIILETPKQEGWTLGAPIPVAIEETATAYRIVVPLRAGERKNLTLVQEKPLLQTMRLLDSSEAQTVRFMSDGAISPALKTAFDQIAQLRVAVAAKTDAEKRLQTALASLMADQARIRDNLARVDKDGDLSKRYTKKLNDQETQIETIVAGQAQAADDTSKAHAALESFIAGLKIERIEGKTN